MNVNVPYVMKNIMDLYAIFYVVENVDIQHVTHVLNKCVHIQSNQIFYVLSVEVLLLHLSYKDMLLLYFNSTSQEQKVNEI